jgi:hypothetical protein
VIFEDELDAATTQPFFRWDPDATSIYDLRPEEDDRRRLRQIREIRRDLVGLRLALAEGWDVGPELVHEEHRLAALEDAAAIAAGHRLVATPARIDWRIECAPAHPRKRGHP